MAHNHKEVVTMTDNELIERILQAQTGEQFLNLVNSENIIEKLHGGNTTIPDATVNELLLRILNIAKDKLSETQYDDFVKQKYMYGETILNLVAFHNPDETENILNYAKNKFTPQEYMAFVSQAFWYDKSTLHYAVENNPDYAKEIINTAKEKLSKAKFKAFFANDITKGRSSTLGETLLHIAVDTNNPELVDFVLDTARSVLNNEELAAFILKLDANDRSAIDRTINLTFYMDYNIKTLELILSAAEKALPVQQYSELIRNCTSYITTNPYLLATILKTSQLKPTVDKVYTYCNNALDTAIKQQNLGLLQRTLTTAIKAVKGLSIPKTVISSPPSIFEYLRVSLDDIDESLAENLAKHLENYQGGKELEFLLANQLKPGIALYISKCSKPSLYSIRKKHSAVLTTTYAEVLSETGKLSLRDRIFCFFTGRFSLAFSVPSPAATKKGAHGGTTTKINPEGSPPPRPGANSGATPNPEEPTVRR